MKGTVYFRKWTRQPWWSRIYHLCQRENEFDLSVTK